MDDINVLHHRCLLNLRRRIRDIGDGRPAQERYMRLQKDGDTLSYQGNSEEVGCYVAGHPLSKGNCYFEVTIVDTGVRGTIAVGLVPKFYRLDHQPGWLPYSVAYHADNGKLYNGNPVGQQFGPKCARNDRIGCGIHSENIEAGLTTVFFTKNGKEVGSVEVPASAEGLFPAVGMHSMGEEVKVDLQAEWVLEEDDSMMMVDSHEDDWGRLYDVRVSGTLLEYVGKGKSIMDVGLAQARQPLTTRCHYYEVEIVDAGEKCYIALGLARRMMARSFMAAGLETLSVLAASKVTSWAAASCSHETTSWTEKATRTTGIGWRSVQATPASRTSCTSTTKRRKRKMGKR
ncbi:SPRY domain-containing protein 3 isoform X2 [Perca fluviatilis]|uniref:SPRY domain-containing protein 3 isoform X2 n=1 Tax=Perca fluviatilis TaxID=8168 RepID=UPI0019631332|nr:SPRY domain-containing protein 3 isoform X2 [Perca fluviatilis]